MIINKILVSYDTVGFSSFFSSHIVFFCQYLEVYCAIDFLISKLLNTREFLFTTHTEIKLNLKFLSYLIKDKLLSL